MTTENDGSMVMTIPRRSPRRALLFFSINLDDELPVNTDMSTIHTGGVEGQSDVAVVIDGDQATRAAEFGDFVEHHLRCLLQFHSAIFHQRRDVVCDNGTNEIFAVSGSRDRAGGIVRVRAAAD